MINDNFGAELSLSLITGKYNIASNDSVDVQKSGFGVMGYGKYYFSPDKGCDKFYVGLYLRQRSFNVDAKKDEAYAAFERDIVALGFGLGYKWVGDQGILFELGLGLGRAISESNKWDDSNNEGLVFPDIGIDGFGRLAVGYRF